MKMPYGSHKGLTIEELPSTYLKWVAEHWDERTEDDKRICSAADMEYTTRERNSSHFESEEETPRVTIVKLDDVLSNEDVKQLAQAAVKYCATKGLPKTSLSIVAALNELGYIITPMKYKI